MRRIGKFLYARYRAFAPFSCFMSPKADILRGFQRWKWLAMNRRTGRLIEPNIQVQGCLETLNAGISCGEKCQVDVGCILWRGNDAGKIHIGNRTYIGPYCYLGAHDHILQIGEDSMIGAGCYLITSNHQIGDKSRPYREQGFKGADVTLGKNVWLGAHVVVLPGVTIGDHAIVGAGGVVTKDIPPGETWAGIPAKKIQPSEPE